MITRVRAREYLSHHSAEKKVTSHHNNDQLGIILSEFSMYVCIETKLVLNHFSFHENYSMN